MSPRPLANTCWAFVMTAWTPKVHWHLFPQPTTDNRTGIECRDVSHLPFGSTSLIIETTHWASLASATQCHGCTKRGNDIPILLTHSTFPQTIICNTTARVTFLPQLHKNVLLSPPMIATLWSILVRLSSGALAELF